MMYETPMMNRMDLGIEHCMCCGGSMSVNGRVIFTQNLVRSPALCGVSNIELAQ